MSSAFEVDRSMAEGVPRHVTFCLVVVLVLLHAPDRTAAESGVSTTPHVVLNDSLDALRADFNAKQAP